MNAPPARLRLLAIAVALATAPALAAQQPDSARRADSTRAAADSARRDSTIRFERLGAPAVGDRAPISPRRAFLYSFLVPGLGQAKLDRPNGGALFATVEMAAVVMTFKARDDLRYARDVRDVAAVESWRVDANGAPVLDSLGRLVPADTTRNRYAPRVRSRRTQYEDWIAVLVFNHIFAGADAFVAAQLWDMPVRGSLRAIGPRTAMIGANVEFGGRRRR